MMPRRLDRVVSSVAAHLMDATASTAAKISQQVLWPTSSSGSMRTAASYATMTITSEPRGWSRNGRRDTTVQTGLARHKRM